MASRWKGKDPSKWADEAEKALTYIYRRSVELTAKDLTTTTLEGGKLPKKTGTLQRSLLASTAGPIMMGKAGATYAAEDPSLLIFTLRLNQKIWFGYRANYAHRLNYGFVGQDSLGRMYNQDGFHFLEFARTRWKKNVETAKREAEKEFT